MEIRRAIVLGFTLFMAGLALCGVGLWLLLGPAQYRATARIEVHEDSGETGYMSFMKAHPNAVVYDPFFIEYVFEDIRSQPVLSNVVEYLNLNVELGKKHGAGSPFTTAKTIELLKQRMSLTANKNTRLIEISFASENPDEAVRIANAIAKAYQDYRLEIRRQHILIGIKVLEDEFQKEEQTIKAKQENLDQLRKQVNVPNADPSEELLKTNYPSYFQAKQEFQELVELHKQLATKNTSEQLVLQRLNTVTLQTFDVAQPPELPAGPNRFLGAALLAIGLFSTVGGFLMLKSSRRSVQL